MPNKQQYSATITIGGAISRSFKQNIGVVRAGLDNVGDAIRDVKKRQAELAKQRRVLEREGKAVDHLDREYEQLGRTLDDLTRKQKKLRNVQSAGVQVGRAFGRVQSEIGGILRTGGILIGGTTAAVFGLTKATADLGDNVAKTADKLGFGIMELQEYRYAAERAGIASNTFDMAAQRSIRRVAEAAKGTGEAKDALKELGLDAVALMSMTPDEMLLQVADAMAEVDTQADRIRLAMKLFDSEGVAMVNMLANGSSELKQMRREARETGYVLSEEAARDAEKYTDTLLDTKLTIMGLRNIIGVQLMPVVTEFMANLTRDIRANRKEIGAFAKRFVEGFRDALPAIGDALRGLGHLAMGLGNVIGMAAKVVGGFENLGIIIGSVVGVKAVVAVGGLLVTVSKLFGALGALGGVLPVVAGGIKAIGLALIANPIGLVIAAIAGAAFLVIKYWEPIKGFFADIWDGMREGAEIALEWILGKFKAVGDAVRSVGRFFGIGDEADQAEVSQPGKAIERAAMNSTRRRSREASEMIAARAPRADRPAQNTTTITTNDRITINQAPGQSPQALVDEIERRKAQRQRAALFDGTEVYGVP